MHIWGHSHSVHNKDNLGRGSQSPFVCYSGDSERHLSNSLAQTSGRPSILSIFIFIFFIPILVLKEIERYSPKRQHIPQMVERKRERMRERERERETERERDRERFLKSKLHTEPRYFNLFGSLVPL